jgi:hypothetical protein
VSACDFVQYDRRSAETLQHESLNLVEETAMPKQWSNKDERQSQHVKQSERERGRPEKRAEEIAARTVNKQRRSEGRTPNKTTQGTGNPGTLLQDRTVAELRNRAAELDVRGRSSMKKDELVRAIRAAQ